MLELLLAQKMSRSAPRYSSCCSSALSRRPGSSATWTPQISTPVTQARRILCPPGRASGACPSLCGLSFSSPSSAPSAWGCRAQAPVIDSLMKELGFDGGSLDALVKGAADQPVETPAVEIIEKPRRRREAAPAPDAE